jgi:hypothetical protein
MGSIWRLPTPWSHHRFCWLILDPTQQKGALELCNPPAASGWVLNQPATARPTAAACRCPETPYLGSWFRPPCMPISGQTRSPSCVRCCIMDNRTTTICTACRPSITGALPAPVYRESTLRRLQLQTSSIQEQVLTIALIASWHTMLYTPLPICESWRPVPHPSLTATWRPTTPQ